MATINEYLDLFEKCLPAVRQAFGNRQGSEIADDVKVFLPIIRLFIKEE